MKIILNCIGELCPMPVVRSKKALDTMECGILEVLVDNNIAVQNLVRLSTSAGCKFEYLKEDEKLYKCLITKGVQIPAFDLEEVNDEKVQIINKTIVVISSTEMGSGDVSLGKSLLKGFIFALTQLEKLPFAVVLYNSGAYLSCEGSDVIDDLKVLEKNGVEILTCGACLNFYELNDRLSVGNVSNMYTIADLLINASNIIKL